MHDVMTKNKRMKPITSIIFASLIIALLSGCKKDLLRTIPNDRISSDIFWKTEADASFAANAVYANIVESANHFFSWDGITDFGHTPTPQSAEVFLLKGQYDALNSRISEDWTAGYTGIRQANSFLANVDRVETTNTALIDRLKAEARTLRAYFYLRLVSLFGDVPLVTTEITLEESAKLTRAPVSQIYDFISTELEAAAAVLPLTTADKGRVTKGVALALNARAMLYAGRFTEATAFARQVIDLQVYSLYPSYKNLFSYAAENNEEVIFDIQFIHDVYSNASFSTMAPYSQKNGAGRYVPTRKLVDKYEMINGKKISDPTSGFDPRNPYKDRDPRLGYSIYVLGDELPDGSAYDPRPNSGTADAIGFTFQSTHTGFNLKKYINKEDLALPGNNGINYILLRYAEVLLTYAEAKIEAGDIDQSVADAINLVRQRADVNLPPISLGSQAELREAVRHEREVELAYEGLHFFDIRRWRTAEQVLPGKIYGMTYVNGNDELVTVEEPGWENFFRSDRDYLWPIPQKEIELNDQLIQNPNW